MRVFGLIGYPLGHSFSKAYFERKFQEEHITDCRFENFPLEQIHLLPDLLHTQKPEGLAVTIPYKTEVLAFAHTCSPEVAAIGAANCLCIHDAHISAHNTDIIGFEQSFLPLWKHRQNNALVLGTGGASKAICFVLNKLNIDYQLVSRNAQPNCITYASLTAEQLEKTPVIINCTPLGTFPDIATCADLPWEGIGPQHYLYDLVYNPSETLFLRRGRQAGATIKNGADMLAIQADANWRLWNNVS